MIPRGSSGIYDPLGQIDQPLERFWLVNPQFDCSDPALPDSNLGVFQVHSKCFRDADATVKSVSANDQRKNSVSANATKLVEPKP